jgi:hypothetical protein
MNSTTLHPARQFVDAVRAALSDLPSDEVDELTDGLEADLAERAADEVNTHFGDPVSYANELRSAAGLPPRSAPRPLPGDTGVAAAWREFVDGMREIGSHPTMKRLGAFFVSLRPIWWLIRAWAFYGILTWLFGVASLQLTPLTFLLGFGTIVVSVQFGRGKWQTHQWLRKMLLGVNIALVAMLPIILLATTTAFGSQVDAAYASGANDQAHVQDGLTYNGKQIENIYVYGADGKPLSGVQLYDQTGRPLYTVADPSMLLTQPPYLVPYDGVHGRGGWNVYPLQFLTANQVNSSGNPKHGASPSPSVLRDLLVPPLKTPLPTATATPEPTATPAP